jgi:hypothetical protein
MNLPVWGLDAMIDMTYRNNETHHAFFKSVVSEHFKLNVPFINRLNENKGKKRTTRQ